MAGSKTKDPIKTLEVLSGHTFKNKSLVIEALTHPSLEGETPYQRLEFLGDRVLGMVIAAHLYGKFGKEPEGRLSRRLAALVRKETLGRIALDLKIGPLIRMTDTVARGGGRENPSILSDVLEALIGALYLDGGYQAAAAFVEKAWAKHLEGKTAVKDPKTGLQEWAQQRGLPLPEYEILEQSGPDHSPSFKIGVSVKGLGTATAKGPSKRQAQTRAAEKLLAKAK